MASRKEPASTRPIETAGQPGEREASEAAWRLPSGQDLVSFALATGFAAHPLLEEPAGLAGGTQRVQDQPEAVGGRRRED